VRFVLDQDVDIAVKAMLRQRGHEAWTVSEAGLASAADDDITVYAHDRGAVLLTHDAEFSRRRRRNTIGRHVRLRCAEPDAVDVLSARLDQLIQILDALGDVVVYLSQTDLYVWSAWD
jgi:predicted nuclease of predicted toxin-antitoxin system